MSLSWSTHWFDLLHCTHCSEPWLHITLHCFPALHGNARLCSRPLLYMLMTFMMGSFLAEPKPFVLPMLVEVSVPGDFKKPWRTEMLSRLEGETLLSHRGKQLFWSDLWLWSDESKRHYWLITLMQLHLQTVYLIFLIEICLSVLNTTRQK